MATNLAKKIVILIIIGIGIFFFGIITVDERQNAIVKNVITKNESILTPGLHFSWPLIERVSYIFMNKRSGLLTMQVNFEIVTNVEVGAVVEWVVIEPKVYYAAIKNDTFSKGLAQKVKQVLDIRAKTTNLSTFNQLNNLLTDPQIETGLGIEIFKISPAELKVNEVEIVKSSDAINEKGNITIDNHNSVTQIESAYYQAQMIKTQTEIEQAKMFQPLEEKSPKFYSFFRKLQIYKTAAKSKKDMPPLEEIYK